MSISRRQFTTIAGTATAVGIPIRGAGALTAEVVVARIRAALGGEWPASGLDGFKAGEPSASVTGIVTTAMATMDVFQRSVQAKSNLVLTYEPTFFGRMDGQQSANAAGPAFRGVSSDDPVYQAKKKFIEKNGLVVFRLHDHWQSRGQGDMTAGLAEALGWKQYRLKADDVIYQVPPAKAEHVVARIRRSLNLRGGLRAVGDRNAIVRRVLLYPGFLTPAIMWQRYTEADLVVTGEVREWENTHYAADMFTAGEKRGLITLGRVASEDPGMRACAAWLKTIVKEVPVQWIPAGDLYWRAV